MTELSNRGRFWMDFASEVLHHVERYTVPQYGDYPNDQLEQEMDISEIVHNMKRYLNRVGRGQRGPVDEIRDCYKLAHYACELAQRKQLELGQEPKTTNPYTIGGENVS